MEVKREILDIVAGGTSEGPVYRLPEGRLDAMTYRSVNKVLEMLGGKWNRKAQAHVFPDDAGERIDAMVLTGMVVDKKRELGFFETGPEVLQRMRKLLAWEPLGLRILEPSAGRGAIALPLARAGAVVDCVDIDPEHIAFMEKQKELDAVQEGDFLEAPPVQAYDAVMMNPPFAKSADVKHIMHAYQFLKPGGRLVSVASSSVMYRSTGLHKSLRILVHGTGGVIAELPAGSFRLADTNVNTCLVYLRAPGDGGR